MEPEDKTEITPTPPEPITSPEPVVSEEGPESVIPKESKPNLLERFWFIPVILAILSMIIVVGLWTVNQGFFSPKATPTPTPMPSPTPETETDSQTDALEEQGTSDEIGAIETDLENTDLSNIDQELTDIEGELATP